jgi:hypothetical protein
MMLARLGKSLILVTIVITLILVVSSTQSQIQMTPLVRPAQATESTEGRSELIYIVFGSFLAIIFMLLIFLAVKGRRVNAEPSQPKVLAFSTQMREESTQVRSGTPLGKVLHPSGALGVFAPQRRNDNWRAESSLVGSTLRMYWSLLCRRHSAVGLREIQRELGFASPSSAIYQLDKLIDLGLVRRDEMGDYVVSRVIKVGLLRDFAFIRGYPLPKSALFGAFMLLIDLTCFAVLVTTQIQIIVSLLAMLPGLISSSIFWYDGLRAFRYKQRLIRSNATTHD